MQRYFFNVHATHDVFDMVGTELPNIREVHVHMIATATAFVEEEKARAGSWEMEVLNSRGRIVASMDFHVETKAV